MKRNGFTLIELIFVIVIIGVLVAVAVPKFKNLKQNAEVSNIIEPLSDLNSSGGASSYLNATELSDINASDLNITNLYKFNGKGWTVDTTNDKATYDNGSGLSAVFTYNNDGTVGVKITCDDATKTGKAYQKALNARDYNCTTSGTSYTIYLDTQD